jgi:protein O-mannosyl-transferase
VPDRAFPPVAALVLAALLGVYSNHFRNGFHFDDTHTITANPYVHDIHNFPRFFSDARTFSILKDHASYRPVVTASVALDYWLGKGADPFWFHVSTFFWYLVELALLYVLFAALMDAAAPDPDNRWFALFAVALYGLHPVSAETVNYIIQRAEIYCALGVVAGLVIYIRFPRLRSSGVYLGPVVVGILSKPPAAVFAVLLFLYILLFKEEWNVLRSGKRAIPALAVCLAAGAFAMHMEAGTFSPGGANPLLYRLTQPAVTAHYFLSFFWPSHLTADSDLALVTGWRDARVLLGVVFVLALCWVACWTARTRATRPVAFGIAWFVLALLPVAWVPLAEVENAHRMFFPFIGLTLAVVWAVRLAAGLRLLRMAAAGAVVLAVCACATWQRNQVWRTEETLWRDVIEKSPSNGRGYMNYGVARMSQGDFNAALAAFQRALPLTPNYSLLHINRGIAEGALGRDAEAERDFARALTLAPDDSQSYFYYARWLSGRGRVREGVVLLEAGIRENPADLEARLLLLQLYARQGQAAKFNALLADSLRLAPRDPDLVRLQPARVTADAPAPPTAESLLSLSLAYYRARRYEECIRAAQQALQLNPNYAEAYNNIAAAWNALGRYDEGARAASIAVRLKPDFKLAQNNLAWAESQQARAGQR